MIDYTYICKEFGLANLRSANLRSVDLCGTDLYGADLRSADLRNANLCNADLRNANLCSADLYGANLYGANLRNADLRGANLRSAYLRNANLYGANLCGADLCGADLPHFQIIPEKGGFTAWKKVRGAVLELYVPSSAKRTSSLIGRKVRVSHAKVIKDYPTTGLSQKQYGGLRERSFVYSVGETVAACKFGDDIRVECTYGIHCFITRKEAEEY